MSEWTTPHPLKSEKNNAAPRGGRGRGGRGRGRGRGRGAIRGPPEVVFASYELSDVQKKRIDAYIMESATMFLGQQIAEPAALAADEAQATILNHWWQSLCMSRSSAGLATDVNASALMYRSYQHGHAAAGELEGLRLACVAADPAAELPDNWREILEGHFPDIPAEAVEALRESITAAAEQQHAKQQGAEQQHAEQQHAEQQGAEQAKGEADAGKLNEPSLAAACVANLTEPQFENCWADAMEEDE